MDISHNISKYAFISYSTKNQAFADAMRNLLNNNGIETWMAPGDIPIGSKYADVINKAVKHCSCFLLVLSNDSQNSVWVAKEVERAINYHKPIFSVQIEDMTLNDEFEFYISTDQLVAIQKIDKNATEIKKLLQSIKAVLKEASSNEVEDSHANKLTEGTNECRIAAKPFCHVILSNKDGSLHFNSADCYDESDKCMVEFTADFWTQFVEICKELLTLCFPKLSNEQIYIKRRSNFGLYKCIPYSFSSNFNLSKNMIYFDVTFLKNNIPELYDSVTFKMEGKFFELTLFKDYEYVFKTAPKNADLSYFRINEADLKSVAVKMLNFIAGDNNIIIGENFRKKVYSDGSGGFFLDYVILE